MVAKRVVFWLVLVIAMAVASRMIPGFVRDSIPAIYYVKPSLIAYESIVRCTGTIHSLDSRQVVLESAVLPREVFVGVGDEVNQGQVLATFKSVTPFDFAMGLPQIMVDSAMISTVLSAYGLTAFLDDAGLNSDELVDFLEQQGRAGTLQTSVAQVDYTGEILSPIGGVVTSVNMTPFIPSGVGSAVFTVMDLSQYKVIATVNESDIAMISVGDPATIRGMAFPGSVYEGYVSKIYPTARRTLIGSSAQTVVDIEIIIQNPDERLRPGFTATVEIRGRGSYEMITVPYEAIRQDERNNEYVYTFNDGVVRRALIVTGREFISEVQVLEGLTQDSIVIFNPNDVDGEGTMIHLQGRWDS